MVTATRHFSRKSPASLRFANKRMLGFSLIEVMVSMLILAFSVLGIVGLQVAAMRSNQFASNSATSVSIVRDYIEMMQANPSLQVSGSTASIFNGAVTVTINISQDSNSIGSAPTDCKGTTADCDPSKLAQFQIYEWLQRSKASLPAGRVKVCHDDAYIDTTTKLYTWTCSNTGELLVIKVGWENKIDRKSNGTAVDTALDDGVDRPKMAIVVFGNQKGYKL
jgi:type IV pilus assembly protein PilV